MATIPFFGCKTLKNGRLQIGCTNHQKLFTKVERGLENLKKGLFTGVFEHFCCNRLQQKSKMIHSHSIVPVGFGVRS